MDISSDDIEACIGSKNQHGEFQNLVGHGTFGSVYKFQYNEKTYAIKELRINKPDNEKAMGEINVLKDLDCENIIKLFDVVPLNEFIKYLILEYMDGGNLHSVIYGKSEYGPKNVYNWFFQASNGLLYLHSKIPVIIHRDVKPNNILLDSSRNTLKLCDFGFSRESRTRMTSGLGTPLYMAPEMVFGTKEYDISVDIYSLCISFGETIIRDSPFRPLVNPNIKEMKEIHEKSKRPDIKVTPVQCTEDVQNLITKGWAIEPEDRPTAKDFRDLFQRKWHELE